MRTATSDSTSDSTSEIDLISLIANVQNWVFLPIPIQQYTIIYFSITLVYYELSKNYRYE